MNRIARIFTGHKSIAKALTANSLCASVALLSLVYSNPALAQGGGEADAKKWDISKAGVAKTKVQFTTSEGTWLNLDVSPDGKEIVFDMLGDIYIMPIGGGKATRIAGGAAFEVQPRFSPDGQEISFTSDRGGADNIWIMKKDGSSPKAVTKEDFRLLNNASWSPDGQYLVARKHFTSTRSLGAGEMWMYHRSGGAGLQLTKKKNDQQDAGEPCFSPDGRYVYFSEDMYPGGAFQYNKDPNGQIFVIRRYDTKEGKLENITGGPGGACRPQINRKGDRLAFVRRVREKSVLYLRNLATGEEWPLFDQLSKDQQEAWTVFGVYANYAWTPDDKAIIIWANGKINRIEVATGKQTVLPFSADVDMEVEKDAVRYTTPVHQDKVDVKVIRNANTSLDGKRMVFNAVGKVYTKVMPDGAPKELIVKDAMAFEPAISPDGKYIAYVTWNDETTGGIEITSFEGKLVKRLVLPKGIFRSPSFSPDGTLLVWQKEEGNEAQGLAYAVDAGLYYMNWQKDREPKLITQSEAIFPQWSADAKRVYFQTGGYLFGDFDKKLKSVNLNGLEERTHFTGRYTNRYVVSPDGKWVLYNELFKVYVAAMPQIGKTIELSGGGGDMPQTEVAKVAGINLHWLDGSNKVGYTLGDRYFSVALRDRFSFLPGAKDSLPDLDSVGIDIGLEIATDKPSGAVLFKNARIITMKGNEVIENGDLYVVDNKIVSLGSAGSLTGVDSKARTIDLKGKTIMPGIVDVHAHLGTFRYGISPQKQWSYYANLAYGVTTTHDPSSNTEMVFSQSEMVKTGLMVGPRIYSTGIILYGADGDFKAKINSLDDARMALKRTQAFGAFSVKSYNQPRREQRQQVLQAARELKMAVVPEGGSFFYHNLTQIIDGHTGIEHNIPIATLYDDVVKLWAATKVGYTPTLIVCYGAKNGENYWYQKTNVWEQERLLRFTPRGLIDSRARHREMIPDSEYENGHILVSKSCKKLSDAGVKVNLGAHGQLQGLGAHWELWMLAQGGMSNHEALRSATYNGAYYLGLDKEIGSLEPGKLADLIVIDGNPLQDIRTSEKVLYTMINGRLYDAATMQEIGDKAPKRSKFWWEQSTSNLSFPWHEDTESFSPAKCVCGKH